MLLWKTKQKARNDSNTQDHLDLVQPKVIFQQNIKGSELLKSCQGMIYVHDVISEKY